ncbi:MAG: hypothetical protein HQM00_16560 [Magnetococcales bacterium]|nr:hypothetical protein [Magnetococcales bacterium]
MSAKLALFVLLTTFSFASQLQANSDALQWRINQCIEDNRDEGVSATVVIKYCDCMSRKMPEKELQSITQWESTHKTEEEECSRLAGWN